SSKDGPGQAAHVSKLNVQADPGAITLTPDPAQLTGGDVTYPLYIDPSVSPWSGGTNHFTEVKSGCPSYTGLYDSNQENGEGIGYQQFDSNCFGLYRSYYEMDTSYLNSSMTILKSTLYLTETYGADHGCNNTWGIGLNLTGGINSGTTWNSQPGTVAGLGQTTVKSAYAGCGNQTVNFDITSQISQYRGYNNLTFGIYGNEGQYSGNLGFMRFSSNPYTVTTFDIAPNAPDTIGTNPPSQNGQACGGTPGWIGMTSLNGNASNITLNARLTTNMSGVNLRGGFHIWDNMANDGSGHPYNNNTMWSSGWTSSGGTVSTNIGFPVSDGHQYGWEVWANDNTLDGPHVTNCAFNVDLTPPTSTMGTSTAFPPLGSGTTPTGHAGDTATVPVSAIDPTPTGCTLAACVSSGVHAFQYSLDNNVPVGGGTTINVTPDSTGKATANIPISVSASQWGTHTLYVRAIDGAGNTQPTPSTYSFYAPWNPGAKVTPGDLTGDGVPDLLATTTDGNLDLVPGNSDPSVSSTVVSTAQQSPDHTGWNNYLIAHRGSLTQQNVDDLFAYNKVSHNLYTYKNDSTTSA
ncbi:DNRLRE domain-containing protein, partial [Kitasatospora sp. NPDC052896]|uniref:DNRLRE domain-containing protein n=1 Tax=Kitasatospora sp. NPDC052896 TaxID=3364061 RepID=UPI0037C9696B